MDDLGVDELLPGTLRRRVGRDAGRALAGERGGDSLRTPADREQSGHERDAIRGALPDEQPRDSLRPARGDAGGTHALSVPIHGDRQAAFDRVRAHRGHPSRPFDAGSGGMGVRPARSGK